MDSIRARGVGLVLLAHSQVKVFQNPSGENYERFELKLDKRAHNFLRERVDGVGYASFGTTVVKGKDDKFKAKTSGKATLTFAPSAAVETKRFSKFPLNCDLTWAAFANGPATNP